MCRTQSVLVVVLYLGFVHSWDIALGKRDLLEFYINNTKTDTVRFNSQNLAALVYDEVHNMILYVDKQSDNDAICGFNMSSMQYKYLTERNGRNIHGLAFDPATELLFFTDTKERSINWISLKPGDKNNVYGNFLIKMDEGIPTDIAVDSCRGYIYWMNTNLTRPAIERARFNGSEREVVINPISQSINATYKMEPHSLALDQQTQSIYWIEYDSNSRIYIYTADLNGKNKKTLTEYYFFFKDTHHPFSNFSNRLTISRESVFMVGWCPTCFVWNLQKIRASIKTDQHTIQLSIDTPASIVANYKVSDQIQGIKHCKALTSLVQNNSLISDPFRIASKYVRQFCVHGMQVIGQSLCKCAPGYIGERCDVSVCDNYCMQGSCSANDDGLPKCRCNAGYSGERCQVSTCYGYCQNGGDCSLNDKSEPVCACKEDFRGLRCEISDCLNYCFQGNCSINDEGLPKCSCDVGYSGARCEVNVCHGYCLNNGDCALNEEDEPFCQCVGNHEGLRCETVTYDTFTTTRMNPAERSVPSSSLTFADVFSKWSKPVSKMTVILEST